MTPWPLISLGELMAERSGSIDPSRFPDEQFDLYSIPAFDSGKPELRFGGEIGSTKQVVEPGDVLLSKIVPHIRRAWVVGPQDGRRLIGSSEWIVFRSPHVEPRYLRHVLVGDPFHAQFMQTVSGVGGSLLRARPSHVADIQIGLPVPEEQRRIADILDRAEALRAKRRATEGLLKRLAQATLRKLLEDREMGRSTWPLARLEDCCVRVTDGTHQSPAWTSEGVPFLFVSNIRESTIDYSTTKFVSIDTYTELTKRCPIEVGDVLYTTVGSYGHAARVKDDRRFCFQRHIAHIKPDRQMLDPDYAVAVLQSDHVRRQADQRVRGIAQKTLNLADLKEFAIPLPPLPIQRELAASLARIERAQIAMQDSADSLTRLSQSLQSRAFNGEL